jgi:acyl-coenzyme A synthetase/AMP-(fatty) acid ligase
LFINYSRCSAKLLQQLLVTQEGVAEAIVVNNLGKWKAYGFVTTTSKEYQTDEKKKELIEFLKKETFGTGTL